MGDNNGDAAADPVETDERKMSLALLYFTFFPYNAGKDSLFPNVYFRCFFPVLSCLVLFCLSK